MPLSCARWLKKMRSLREAGAHFVSLWVSGPADAQEAELIYYLRMPKTKEVPGDNPEDQGPLISLQVLSEGRSVPSLYGLFGTADWAEREACRLFHIKFVGNPNLRLTELEENV